MSEIDIDEEINRRISASVEKVRTEIAKEIESLEERVSSLEVIVAPEVPEDHHRVIDRIKVTTFPHEEPIFHLVPKCVMVGYEVPPEETVRVPTTYWIFKHRKPYPKWYDVGMVLCIWGNTERGYSLEFARLDAMTLRIYVDGELKFEFPDVSKEKGMVTGYVAFTLAPR